MNVSVERAAKLMGLYKQTLRVMIQQHAFDFAEAKKLKKDNKRLKYYINSYGLAKHLGMSEEEVLS